MTEGKNQPENFQKPGKKILFLAVLSASFLLISIAVLYPLSTDSEEQGTGYTPGISFAKLFYLFQAASLILALVVIVESVSLFRKKMSVQNYLILILILLVLATFAYELYWVGKRIP
jgi:cell division protein FtsW (lipid II flippase)